MLCEQLVVEDFVAIVQGGKELVLGQVGGLSAVLLVGASNLILESRDGSRKQAFEPERGALLGRECCPAVEARVGQDAPAVPK
jgi:hypothetical protein